MRPLQRLAMGYTDRGSNPDGGEIFRTRSARPWSPPSLLHNGYPGVKRPEVKERIEPYLYSPLCVLMDSSRVNFTFTFYRDEMFALMEC